MKKFYSFFGLTLLIASRLGEKLNCSETNKPQDFYYQPGFKLEERLKAVASSVTDIFFRPL